MLHASLNLECRHPITSFFQSVKRMASYDENIPLESFNSAGATGTAGSHSPGSATASSHPQNTDELCPMSESKMIEKGIIDTQAYPSGIPPEIMKLLENRDRIKRIYENCRDVNILITGVTGSGKSALANAFLGRTEPGDSGAREEGYAIRGPCTKRVEGSIAILKQRIGIKVWDTPGLMDSANNTSKYLKEIQEVIKRYEIRDLVIFCIEAEPRFVPTKENKNVQAMIKLTKKFGPSFWENAIIVLTYANNIEHTRPNWIRLSKEDKIQAFKEVLKEYEDKIKNSMKNCVGIDPKIVDKMKVVPAGHHTKPELIDRTYWFTTLWFACLHTIPTEAGRTAFAYGYEDRIVFDESTTPEDSPYNIYLKDNFVPEELRSCVKKYKIKGGLIGLLGLLGGPLVVVTIPLGVWAGGKHGNKKYAQDIRPTERQTDSSLN